MAVEAREFEHYLRQFDGADIPLVSTIRSFTPEAKKELGRNAFNYSLEGMTIPEMEDEFGLDVRYKFRRGTRPIDKDRSLRTQVAFIQRDLFFPYSSWLTLNGHLHKIEAANTKAPQDTRVAMLNLPDLLELAIKHNRATGHFLFLRRGAVSSTPTTPEGFKLAALRQRSDGSFDVDLSYLAEKFPTDPNEMKDRRNYQLPKIYIPA